MLTDDKNSGRFLVIMFVVFLLTMLGIYIYSDFDSIYDYFHGEEKVYNPNLYKSSLPDENTLFPDTISCQATDTLTRYEHETDLGLGQYDISDDCDDDNREDDDHYDPELYHTDYDNFQEDRRRSYIDNDGYDDDDGYDEYYGYDDH